jgi:hypothetical protein
MCHCTAVISIIYRSPGLTAITNVSYGNAQAFPDEALIVVELHLMVVGVGVRSGTVVCD